MKATIVVTLPILWLIWNELLSPAKINEFLRSFFRDCSQIHILSIESVQYMLNDDRESIMNNIRFKTFKDYIYIATGLNVNDDVNDTSIDLPRNLAIFSTLAKVEYQNPAIPLQFY